MTALTREDIAELLARYAWAYDTNDKAGLAAAFAAGADYELDVVREDGEARFARFVLVLDRPF